MYCLVPQEKGICFDFLKGLCQRGLLCRFSHDLRNLQAPSFAVGFVPGETSFSNDSRKNLRVGVWACSAASPTTCATSGRPPLWWVPVWGTIHQ